MSALSVCAGRQTVRCATVKPLTGDVGLDMGDVHTHVGVYTCTHTYPVGMGYAGGRRSEQGRQLLCTSCISTEPQRKKRISRPQRDFTLRGKDMPLGHPHTPDTGIAAS